MTPLEIKSNIHSYTVYFEQNLDFLEKLIAINHSVFMIDQIVYTLYFDFFKTIAPENLYLFDAKEEYKTLESVTSIYEFLASKNAKKNLTLISIGGGITQDVSGFVASTLYRGIKWIFIPTTFLAQVDSCIGSKTSLNFQSYKNILGGFYPPHCIYVAPKFLETLDLKDYYSGIGEVIKFALLEECYPKNFDGILQQINHLHAQTHQLDAIHKTMAIKSAYIKEDEFDTGKRNLFNYGHCFGHALETASSYRIPHGIAVTIGMIFANYIAVNRNLLSETMSNFITQKLLKPSIFISLSKEDFGYESLLSAMKNDKKRIGSGLTMIIPIDDEIRATKIDDLSEEEFAYALDQTLNTLDFV